MLAVVRSKRFAVSELRIDGGDVRLKYGGLVVVAHEEATAVDWECVATPVDHEPLDQGAYRLDVVTLEGRELHGDAVLVRSVGGTHVLRGAGPLHGVADDELHD
jgi:hypothetical protein